ncbi:MAG: hypothetical protein QME96_17225 [Myxococcota bacterium]|nr:hypothetical protein [Myxococcota bacterium]
MTRLPRSLAASALLPMLVAAPSAGADRALSAWAELDLRIDVPGATVEVDTGQFCPLPCSMLLAPGPRRFTLDLPGADLRTLDRVLEAGNSLRIEAARSGPDVLGVVLYAVGLAAVVAAAAMVSYDVAVNVGHGRDDWNLAFGGVGLAIGGVLLAIWGAARDPGGEDGDGPSLVESVVGFEAP